MIIFHFFKTAFFSFLLTLYAFSYAYADNQPKAVVELFTSQGCSSCPPADEVLADYAQSKNVLALSFHVDYWNYLGWHDTFSQPVFTERQRRYAKAFQRRQIYTPQAVVNGRNHVVGSRADAVKGLINGYAQKGEGLNVSLVMERSADNIHVFTDSKARDFAGDAMVLLVYYNKRQKVDITRGENRGRTVEYFNVVGHMVVSGAMRDGQFDMTLPLAEMKRLGFDACAVLLQQSGAYGGLGPIVGAVVIEDL